METHLIFLKRLGSVVWTLLAAVAPGLADGPALGPAPFEAGERAVYQIRYGPVVAGTMTLNVDTATAADVSALNADVLGTVSDSLSKEVPPDSGGDSGAVSDSLSKEVPPDSGGEPLWLFHGTAVSSGFVSVFYTVNDAIRGWVDPKNYRPRRLEIHVDESGERGRREVVYDPASGVAHYLRDRTFHRKRGPNRLERDDPLDPEAVDALSLFFHLRSLALAPGQEFGVMVHENGKNRPVRVAVAKRETISTPRGKVKTLPVAVRLILEGKLESQRAFRIWLSDDDRRVPVKFAAELAFGSVKGVLVEYAPGGSGQGDGGQGKD